MSVLVLQADARSQPLPDGCVDLVVTSPPYFGLRPYTDGGAHYAGQLGSEATPVPGSRRTCPRHASRQTPACPTRPRRTLRGDQMTHYCNWRCYPGYCIDPYPKEPAVPDQTLIDIGERVLDQRLTTAYDLASAACPNDEQRKGIDLLWLHIGMSWGQFYAHAAAIAKAHEEGLALASELKGTT